MRTQSSILACKTSWTEEIHRLQSMVPTNQRPLSDWVLASLASWISRVHPAEILFQAHWQCGCPASGLHWLPAELQFLDRRVLQLAAWQPASPEWASETAREGEQEGSSRFCNLAAEGISHSLLSQSIHWRQVSRSSPHSRGVGLHKGINTRRWGSLDVRIRWQVPYHKRWHVTIWAMKDLYGNMFQMGKKTQ